MTDKERGYGIKIKLCLPVVLIITAILFCSPCLAAEPAVEREYIARSVDGVKSCEERVSVDYMGLALGDGDRIRITFYDSGDAVLDTYELVLYEDTPLNEEISFGSASLGSADYVYIEIIGSGCDPCGIGLSLK